MLTVRVAVQDFDLPSYQRREAEARVLAFLTYGEPMGAVYCAAAPVRAAPCAEEMERES
jgi:hypothetical protein